MKTWKLILEYDGSRYSGWAEQQNAPKTVMGELRKAAEDILRSGVDVGGSGRTDAGVHAAAQVAHLRGTPKRPIAPQLLQRLLNEALPADIAILSVEEMPAKFDARQHAVSRSYVYQISTRKTAFSKKYVWWIKEPLDVAKMREAAAMIPGRHDFVRFCAKDPSKPGQSTIVVVNSASVEEQDDLILFHIEATHFLMRMVRRLAGCLVKVGLGELPVQGFAELMAARGHNLDAASWTAPAAGLFLEKVNYPKL